jgi:serine/threonine protein kinase
MKRAERNIYLIMEYCSGGDLTNYIKKRGRVENLQYIPEPGAAPQYYPHPRSGGLAETVVRSFLRQLGTGSSPSFFPLRHGESFKQHVHSSSCGNET